MTSGYLIRDEEIRAIARGLREVSDAQLAYAAQTSGPFSNAGRAVVYEQKRRLAFSPDPAPAQSAAAE